ncbi:MAG: type III-A CRISPR-associated RAMP protein Csm5 [Endomicrobia bacterium]|nr:type III-A CRISPR-associated RAMP protein Csm5 [Endomicrobiia bacterium]MCL2506286.1 type III-A CRISPR-associated RAMP protein Csm5 [Endomicrobiia bacterium]
MKSEIKNIRVHTLTPVHIGDGTEYQPSNFYIDNGELCEFEVSELFKTFNDAEKKEFYNVCQNPDSFSLQKLMKLSFNKKPESFKKTKVASSIAQTYRKCLENKKENEISQFGIKKTVQNPNTRRAYIPGSSLKGAVRTGFISSLTKNKHNFIDEKKLLGEFHEDVFTTFKVSDFVPPQDIKTSAHWAIRVRKKERKDGKNGGVPVMLESINPGSVFEGSISLIGGMDTKIKITAIEDILNKLEEYSKSVLGEYPLITDIGKIQKSFNNKTYLCRLGGYIGAESHTIEGYREIEIRNPKKPRDIRAESTMNLYASQAKDSLSTKKIPFGWCLIEVLGGDSAVLENAELKNFIADQASVSSSNPVSPNVAAPQTARSSVSAAAPVVQAPRSIIVKIDKIQKAGAKYGVCKEDFSGSGFMETTVILQTGDKCEVQFLGKSGIHCKYKFLKKL